MEKLLLYTLLWLPSTALLLSCEEALEVEPVNIISPDIIFSNESAIDAYMVSLYNQLPIEDYNFGANGFNNFNGWNNYLGHLCDEMLSCQNDQRVSYGDGTWLNAVGHIYRGVRNVNEFIEKIPNSTLATDKIKHLSGEARFIRAYFYFGLAKRYGGMPIITEVQTFDGDISPLQLPRSTEEEIYDFIAADLDNAINNMDAGSIRGRANKMVAYALKSRVMIYAAAIAKYGEVQLDALVGIPQSKAAEYWQAAYDAARVVIDEGGYSLYNERDDKVENFRQVFLNKDNNPEAILVKDFVFPEKTHNYDLFGLPSGVRSVAGYGGRIAPTLELVEAFEYIDNPDGTLKVSDENGNPVHYQDPMDLYKGKDPRLFASVIVPFSIWRGEKIEVQAGLIHGDRVITTGNYNTFYDPETGQVGDKGVRIIGSSGIGGGSGEVSLTGFHPRKFLDPSKGPSDIVPWRGEVQYIDLRLAEVLLNYAEAAIELGNTMSATRALNEIRGRAGISLLAEGQVNVEKVRRERRVELAFENHRYWDLRRWRIADNVLSDKKFTAIYPYLVLDDNTYVFEKVETGPTRFFFPQLYYQKIGDDEIDKNPALIQNPLY